MTKLINRELVHKQKYDNVLLANLRRILPRSFSLDDFNALLQELNSEEAEVLRKVYKPLHSDSIYGPGPRLVMKEALGSLRLSSIQYKAVLEALPEDMAIKFGSAYGNCVDIEDGGHHFLNNPLDDDLLNRVIKSGAKHEYYVDNSLQAQVSSILEQHLPPSMHPEYRQDIYFANMVVNTGHAFFFEHPNEHVPGIMILEASRQMIIACSHAFGNITLEGSIMILDLLEARFSGFLELYSPIVLRGEVTQKREHHGHWVSVTLEISIHQNGLQLGVVTCSGSNIGSRSFRRIRRMKRDELVSLPFLPADDLDYTMLLKSQKDVRWSEVLIRVINLSGFTCVSKDPTEVLSKGEYDFVLVVPGLGAAKGQCRWQGQSEEEVQFVIDGLSKPEEEQLELILKRYCKVPEEAVY
jgi:hypothetical protein